MGRGLRVVKLLHDLLHEGDGVALCDRLGNVVLVGLRHLVVVSHPRVTTAALEWDCYALVESGPVARAGGGGVGALQNRRTIYDLRVLLAEAQHLGRRGGGGSLRGLGGKGRRAACRRPVAWPTCIMSLRSAALK